jgi:hypothetical protein
MLAAEKTVRHANKKYHWSKALEKAGQRVRYWKTRLSDLQSNTAIAVQALLRFKSEPPLN